MSRISGQDNPKLAVYTEFLGRYSDIAILQSWENGAGEGNRTLVVSLGSFCSTIELHPQRPLNAGIRDKRQAAVLRR